MKERFKCNHNEKCSAPLCPMLPDDKNSDFIWYPDEEICRKRKGIPEWIKQQRKIAKKADPSNYEFYFTLEMLKINFRVTQQVIGLDPNLPLDKEKQQLKSWRKRNKGSPKRQITNKQRDKKREIVALARLARQQQMEAALMNAV